MARHIHSAAAIAALAFMMIGATLSQAAPPAPCTKIVLTGQADASHEWSQPIGQGWFFRVLPIQAGKAGYTGWDLVVDRDPPAGFPDASSSPPRPTTPSANARSPPPWPPRAGCHRLESPQLSLPHRSRSAARGPEAVSCLGRYKDLDREARTGRPRARRRQRLLEINRKSSPGQFRILNARLTPGIADAAPFAPNGHFNFQDTAHHRALRYRSGHPMGQLQWIASPSPSGSLRTGPLPPACTPPEPACAQ